MTMRVAVDIVLFGYAEQRLHLLLIRRKYAPIAWALPGGFVLEDEDLETAVARELREEAGVANVYLEQLYTFGAVARDPRRRVISVAYYGLVKPEQFTLLATTDSLEAKWFRLETLPELAFDHADIINMAHQRLRAKVTYQPVGFELLPDKFLFSDLQRLYETLLGRELDRRNFRKKILSLGIVEETGEKQQNVAHRAGSLFRFNKQRYEEMVKSGFYFEL
jgi:8-oxo-dGTP diphosphatase